MSMSSCITSAATYYRTSPLIQSLILTSYNMYSVVYHYQKYTKRNRKALVKENLVIAPQYCRRQYFQVGIY